MRRLFFPLRHSDLSRDGANFFSPATIFLLNVLRDIKVSSRPEISHPVRLHYGKYVDEAPSPGIIPTFSIFRFRVPVGSNSGGNDGRFFVVFQNSSACFSFFLFRAPKFFPFQYQIRHYSGFPESCGNTDKMSSVYVGVLFFAASCGETSVNAARKFKKTFFLLRRGSL